MTTKPISVHIGEVKDSEAVVHSIPCNIDHNGPAAVENYFHNCNKTIDDEGMDVFKFIVFFFFLVVR